MKRKIQSIRSDCGSEFLSDEFTKLYKDSSMEGLTNAGTLEQNGVVEWTNKKLLEIIWSMRVQVGAPRFLWTELINTMAFLLNHSPTSANPQVTPFERFFNREPDLSFLWIYGSKVHLWVDRNERDKLQAKAKIGLFVGYDDKTKGFRV